MLRRPLANEYNPYFEKYINLVPDGNLLDILKKQQIETNDLLETVSEAQGEYRYEPGKWSLKEVLGHMADTERVMSYRLLVVARGDSTELPSFEQDIYVEGAEFNRLSLQNLKSDLVNVRQSTFSLVANLSDDAWSRVGTVSDYATSARALAYVITGHWSHHLAVIKEKYLTNWRVISV